MVVSQEAKKIVKQPVREVAYNIEKNLELKHWHISYSDHFVLNGGEELYELFGVSPSFSGSTILSLWGHGARNVAFFVRIRSIKKETEIIAIAGGSESFFGTDWGRNKKIIDILFEFCNNKPSD